MEDLNVASLWKLVINNDYNAVKGCIDYQQAHKPDDVPLIRWKDNRSQTALHIACLCNATRTAEILMDAGADFYELCDRGASPYVNIVAPNLRQQLKQYAFDVSPAGIIYWAEVRVK